METDNFYLHLPSNNQPTSPQEVGNTISNYITRLNQKLNLSEEWEVGLTDISYTKSWYNIMKDQKLKLVDYKKKVIELDDNLEAGNYETVNEIIDSINRIYFNYVEKNSTNKVAYPPNLIYNKQSNKIRVRLGAKLNEENPYLFPVFSEFLAQLLGMTDSQNRQYPYVDKFTPIKVYELKSKQKSNSTTENSQKSSSNRNQNRSAETPIQTPQKLPPTDDVRVITPLKNVPPWMMSDESPDNREIDTTSEITKRSTKEGGANFETKLYVEGFKEVTLHGTIHSLYVYCSIIKPVLVGNCEAPLIRRVEIPNNKNFGDTIEINYPQPQYYPLVSYEFDNIEIDIKDDTDNSLDFAFGRTAVTLHFRKKINNGLKSIYSALR